VVLGALKDLDVALDQLRPEAIERAKRRDHVETWTRVVAASLWFFRDNDSIFDWVCYWLGVDEAIVGEYVEVRLHRATLSLDVRRQIRDAYVELAAGAARWVGSCHVALTH
jgi:hypothetical protein